MKIKTKQLSYNEVLKLPKERHERPVKPSFFASALQRIVANKALNDVNFKYEKIGMERAGDGPWLVLMNHSSFLDSSIVPKLMYPKRYNTVVTLDGFVGKKWGMRQLGCIPASKFATDISLVSDIKYALKENKTSVLMYPEASYSIDGTATPLPRKLGTLFKLLDVPVVMIMADGSFARVPRYNLLQKREVDVSATMSCLLTTEEIKTLSVAEIDDVLDKAFSFDYFKWQKDNNVIIDEPFRADGLDKVLYRCPRCECEGKTEGKGTKLVCHNCGAEYELTELGEMKSLNGKTEFSHIPSWFAWERECVKKEVESGTYLLDADVDIGVIMDTKALYKIGTGHLRHDSEGFHLTSDDGQLDYYQKADKVYSLFADFFWYETEDLICIGNRDMLYHCFPTQRNVCAKARLASEEMYKIAVKNKKEASASKKKKLI